MGAIVKKSLYDRNVERANAAFWRIKTERESVPHLAELWRGACDRPFDSGPIAPLADCLIETGRPEMVAQGEYFRRTLQGVPVRRSRLGHWIAELSDTHCVSQQALHAHGTHARYAFSTLKWALPWLRVFGLFPVIDLRCADRRPVQSAIMRGEVLYHRNCNIWLRAENDIRIGARGGKYDLSVHSHTIPHDIFKFFDTTQADFKSQTRVGYVRWDLAMMACSAAIVDYARWSNGLATTVVPVVKEQPNLFSNQ